jgi:hypothetical protein
MQPHDVEKELEAAYQALALEEQREAEALEWAESAIAQLEPD